MVLLFVRTASLDLFEIAPVNPAKDIFLEMLEIELSLPCDNTIRKVMEVEASHQGLNLNKSRLAELQPHNSSRTSQRRCNRWGSIHL